jgi:dynein assembly factor 5
MTFGFSSISPLYETFALTLFEELKTSSNNWLRSSRDRFLFETFVMQSGRSNRLFLKEIVEILINVMQPDRDPEVRNQCLLIIAHLLQFIDDPNEETSTLSPYLTVLIDRCIMPNMQWKAGRTAAAIRATSIATLWSLFQAKSFRFDQVKRKNFHSINFSRRVFQYTSSMNELLVAVLGMLDDDDRLTRMNSCYVLQALFSNDDAVRTIDDERLHKSYPDLLKRLDDISDDIRLAMCSTLNAYIRAFNGDFNVDLYRAHLEDIAKILLIHMDDQNVQIQEAIFGNSSPFSFRNFKFFIVSETIYRFATELRDAAETFSNEIRQVKHKHRNQTLCETLCERINGH